MNDYENKDGLHIELYSLFRDIVLNIWVVILAALIGLMSVNIWNHSMHTPMYTSTATLLVNIRNSAAYSDTNLCSSTEMAESFTEVFKQSTMKQYAADYLGMGRFEGSVSSSVLDNTNIFTVSVTSSSPEMSYRELCAILEVYPQISEFVFSDSVIEIMRSPNLPSHPSNTISDRNKTRSNSRNTRYCIQNHYGMSLVKALIDKSVMNMSSIGRKRTSTCKDSSDKCKCRIHERKGKNQERNPKGNKRIELKATHN